MGCDIHVDIVDKDGKYIVEEFIDWRNYAWFDRIHEKEDDYSKLNWIYNVNSDFVPQDIKRDFNKKEVFGYYGFKAVSVADLIAWYNKYQPNIDAGWVTKYTAWKMNRKEYIPSEDEVWKNLSSVDIVEDMIFVEYETREDDMKDVIEKVKEVFPESEGYGDCVDYPDDVYVIFYFDC